MSSCGSATPLNDSLRKYYVGCYRQISILQHAQAALVTGLQPGWYLFTVGIVLLFFIAGKNISLVYLSRLSIVIKPQIYLLYLITYYANQQDGTLVYSFSLWLSWYLSLYDKSVATVSMSRIALCRIVQTCVWLAQLFKLKIIFSSQQSNYDTLASSTFACTLL